MGVKLGAGNISKLYLGATEINKAYLGATLVYDAAPAPSYDADYQAILDYATAQGITLPNEAQQTLQNSLLLEIKAAGAWSKLRFFAVHAGGGDQDFAVIDWKSPGVINHQRLNSPIYNAATGFSGDGVSAGIVYDYNPVVAAENHELSFGSHYSGVESNFQRPLHDNGSGQTRRIGIITDNRGGSIPDLSTRHGANNNDLVAQTIPFGGHIHVNRNEISNYKVYKNGALLSLINSPFTNYLNANLRSMGSSFDFLSVQISYAAGDLQDEIVGFSAAITNYINAL